jgi:hypothetical protein
MPITWRSYVVLAALVGCAVTPGSILAAQAQPMRLGAALLGWGAGEYDGTFQFCRVAFRTSFQGDGNGWDVDYPGADVNFSMRLSELTRTRVGRDAFGRFGHRVVRLTDPELFECPFVMMTEPGGAWFDDAEVGQLRLYLQKGGFLWADDFWGSYAWTYWVGQISKVLPPSEYPIIDLPLDHPLFRTHVTIQGGVPQIPAIGFWPASGTTSERGADSAEPHGRAILDADGRLMVFMTHNTDIGDSWEREGESALYFHRFSIDGYALGVNVLLYALMH